MDSLREQWLILISTPIYTIIIGLELLFAHFQLKKAYTFKDSFTNFYLMLMNGAIDIGFRIIYVAILQFFYLKSVFTIQYPILYWFSLLILEDFLYYWLHRFDHQVRLFWAVHITHHSSKLMNFTVGFRSSVFQPLYRFIYFIPLAILGFKPLDILFIYAATQIWGIFVHTEFIHKLGWLEYILVTPSHHRVHHGSNIKYLDKNMGMFLIIWDKLFGTFQTELTATEYEPIQYGLTKNINSHHPLTVIFHEWRGIFKDITQHGISFKSRWLYLFGPPGWSHDHSRYTSKQLRKNQSSKKIDAQAFPTLEQNSLSTVS